MKKKYVIIIAALLIVAIAVAVPLAARPKAEPAVSPAAEPLPEPATVYIDKDKGISATIGVEGGDSERVVEQQSEEPAEGQPLVVDPSPSPASTPSPDPSPSPEPSPSPTPTPVKPVKTSYEQFLALSSEQKDEFMHSFESMDAFFEWLTAAQEEYKNAHPEIEIGPGDIIDLGEQQ